jgi:hypothetical protein
VVDCTNIVGLYSGSTGKNATPDNGQGNSTMSDNGVPSNSNSNSMKGKLLSTNSKNSLDFDPLDIRSQRRREGCTNPRRKDGLRDRHKDDVSMQNPPDHKVDAKKLPSGERIPSESDPKLIMNDIKSLNLLFTNLILYYIYDNCRRTIVYI